MISRSWIQFQCAYCRHNQKVSQIGVAGTAEMGMAEPDYATIFILVAGAIGIDTGLVFPIDVVGNRIGVRTQLDEAERLTGTGERMPHAICPDDRIDPVNG